jgi:hypothetical protein
MGVLNIRGMGVVLTCIRCRSRHFAPDIASTELGEQV